MKKIFVFLSLVLLLLCGCAKEEDKGVKKLCVKDGSLCTVRGEQVQLKGVSTQAITRTQNFINNDLFSEMKNDWGIDVVRRAMYVIGQDAYTKSDYFRETNISLVKQCLDLCIANDLYCIVDWHVLDDKNPLTYMSESKEFFDLISKEYADSDNIIYEICNEPNNTRWSDIKKYAEEVIPVIRNNDPDAVIIVGTPDWSQGVDRALADPLDFENIMYSLHFYSASHKDELRNRMIDCLEAGLPIFVTEYGVTHSSGEHPRDLEEADRWMEVLDRYKISSCIWNLSRNGQACALINKNSLEASGFTEADFTETGKWFLRMLKK